MNKVVLVGRLTKDPEAKTTSSQVPFTNFTVAVDRRFKDPNGQRQADFINCVAWRQTATFINNYFHKGSKIGIVGSIQTRTYEGNDGQKRYVTEVVVDEAEFVESAGGGNGGGSKPSAPQYGDAPQPAAGSIASGAQAAPDRPIDVGLDGDIGTGDGSLPFEM